MLGVNGLGLRFSGFRVQGLGFRVCRVQILGFRIGDIGLRV